MRSMALSRMYLIMAVATVARPVRALKSVRWVGEGETRRPGGMVFRNTGWVGCQEVQFRC